MNANDKSKEEKPFGVRLREANEREAAKQGVTPLVAWNRFWKEVEEREANRLRLN